MWSNRCHQPYIHFWKHHLGNGQLNPYRHRRHCRNQCHKQFIQGCWRHHGCYAQPWHWRICCWCWCRFCGSSVIKLRIGSPKLAKKGPLLGDANACMTLSRRFVHIVFVIPARSYFSIGVVAAAFALSQHLAWAFFPLFFPY